MFRPIPLAPTLYLNNEEAPASTGKGYLVGSQVDEPAPY